jgi:hypothetical protein
VGFSAAGHAHSEHIRDVLLRFSSGELSADIVCDWASTVEMRDDIEYDAKYSDEIADALRELSDPVFSAPLDGEAVVRLLKTLAR